MGISFDLSALDTNTDNGEENVREIGGSKVLAGRKSCKNHSPNKYRFTPCREHLNPKFSYLIYGTHSLLHVGKALNGVTNEMAVFFHVK